MSNKQNIYQLLEGPSIEARFEIKEDLIQSISLHPSLAKGLTAQFLSSHPNSKLEEWIKYWLESYVKGLPPHLSLPLNWKNIPPFTRQVLEIIQAIPFGSTLTYGKIAELMNNHQASRAVGGACGRNPFPLIIPCHRVISVGNLRGFSEGIEIKKHLLSFEGVL